jgi:alpha-tubulin suppressor-like RCC1 family protein
MTTSRKMMMATAGAGAGVEVPTEGQLWYAGDGQFGQTGRGSTSDNKNWTNLTGDATWSRVACGDWSSLGYKANGTLWTWGRGADGQSGHGDTTNRSSPVQVGSLTNWGTHGRMGAEVSSHIKTDGTLWVFGNNQHYQVGDGTTTHRSSPVQIGSATNWASVGGAAYSSCAINTSGQLYTWGRNTSVGTCGQGHDSSNIQTPTQVGSLTNWKHAASLKGNSIICSKTDGTMWAWGTNGSGRLGLGDTSQRNSPVQVGSLTNWGLEKDQLSGGQDFTLAIKQDGTMWAWGNNSKGQLGQGNTTNQSSPVQVGSASNWAKVGGGHNSAYAINTSGELYVWGYNSYSSQVGHLGLDDNTNRSTPVLVSSGWVSAFGGYAHTMGVKES